MRAVATKSMNPRSSMRTMHTSSGHSGRRCGSTQLPGIALPAVNGMATAILTSTLFIGLALMPGSVRAQVNYEPYAFTHLAGAFGGIGSSDGTGSAARFVSPIGVATDSVGNVYVADSDNNTIQDHTCGRGNNAGWAGWIRRKC